MAKRITEGELCDESGEIMRALDRGESFVLTRNGVEIGELMPLRRHQFVPAETATATFSAAPGIDADQFRGDIDAVIDQDPRPRP